MKKEENIHFIYKMKQLWKKLINFVRKLSMTVFVDKYLNILEKIYVSYVSFIIGFRKPNYYFYLFFFKIGIFFYDIFNFSFFKRIIKFFLKKQSISVYNLVIEFISYFLDKINYFIYFFVPKFIIFLVKLLRFIWIDMAVVGFFSLIYWFIRFFVYGKVFFWYYTKLWYYCVLFYLIYYVQRKGRGFYYISEEEREKWWNWDWKKEAAFKEILKGTDLDMDKEWVVFYYYFIRRYIFIPSYFLFTYIFYCFLFVYIVLAYIFLIILVILSALQVIYVKYFKQRTKFIIKFKLIYFFTKIK